MQEQLNLLMNSQEVDATCGYATRGEEFGATSSVTLPRFISIGATVVLRK